MLLESEERFRTMANTIPQLAWIAHSDGYIYWYNERWYSYTGTTPEQMEGGLAECARPRNVTKSTGAVECFDFYGADI
jgi:PAS domain S-box-containing protein